MILSFQRAVTTFAVMAFVSGCASKAWVIQRDPNGGIIGYKGFSTSEAADKAIKELIPCSNFKMINDELHTSQFTGFMPVQSSQTTNGTAFNNYGNSLNYQATTTGTQYVPVTVDNSFRTFTYSCEFFEISQNVSSKYEDERILYQNVEPAEPKAGTLNLQKVLLQCDAGKRGRKLLKTTFDIEQAKLKKEGEEIKKLEYNLKKNERIYSDTVKQEKSLEIEARINAIKISTGQKQKLIEDLELGIKTSILALIKSTVDEIGLQKGYTLIQESEEASADDISEEVIKKVNEKSK